MNEIKWVNQGNFWSRDCKVIFAEDDNKIENIEKRVITVVQYNSRIIAIIKIVKLDTKPVNIFVTQV